MMPTMRSPGTAPAGLKWTSALPERPRIGRASGPLRLLRCGHFLRPLRQLEDHARGAAHVEPAVVGAGLHGYALVLMIGKHGAQNVE
jgi:hypothetical protein